MSKNKKEIKSSDFLILHDEVLRRFFPEKNKTSRVHIYGHNPSSPKYTKSLKYRFDNLENLKFKHEIKNFNSRVFEQWYKNAKKNKDKDETIVISKKYYDFLMEFLGIEEDEDIERFYSSEFFFEKDNEEGRREYICYYSKEEGKLIDFPQDTNVEVRDRGRRIF